MDLRKTFNGVTKGGYGFTSVRPEGEQKEVGKR
jgi:hypothetical protein